MGGTQVSREVRKQSPQPALDSVGRASLGRGCSGHQCKNKMESQQLWSLYSSLNIQVPVDPGPHACPWAGNGQYPHYNAAES